MLTFFFQIHISRIRDIRDISPVVSVTDSFETTHIYLNNLKSLLLDPRHGGASDIVSAESGEDPRATGGLVCNLPHFRINKTKQHSSIYIEIKPYPTSHLSDSIACGMDLPPVRARRALATSPDEQRCAADLPNDDDLPRDSRGLAMWARGEGQTATRVNRSFCHVSVRGGVVMVRVHSQQRYMVDSRQTLSDSASDSEDSD